MYRLRYECYRRRNSIPENSKEQFSDEFDEKPNNFSFLIRNEQGQAVATVRITVVRPDIGWNDSPAAHVFGDHPALQQIAQASYVEASRLCSGPLARRDAFIGLVSRMAAVAQFCSVEWMVACPRVEHATAYQRMFGFRPLAAPREYFGVTFQTQLLGIRVTELTAHVQNARVMKNAWSKALDQLVHSVD